MRAVLRLRSYDGLMDATNRVDGVYVQNDDRRNERRSASSRIATGYADDGTLTATDTAS